MAASAPQSRTSRAIAAVIAATLRRRALALALTLLALVLALAGALRLRLDFSSTAFYGDGSVAARGLVEHQARWGADDDTLLILVAPLELGDRQGVLSDARLAAIAELARALESGPEVTGVVSVAGAPGEGGASLGELLASAELDAQTPAQRRELLARLPFVPTLLSETGELTAIAVELSFSTDDVLRTRATVDALEQLIAGHDDALRAAGLGRALAGVPATRASFAALVLRDQMIFVPLTLALIGLALRLVFRRLHGVLIPALAAALPTVALVGIMGWTGEPLGLLNQAYFTLLPVIAVADAIHYVARVHEERRADADATREQVIIRAGAQVGVACLLTSVTTAAGFASLGLAQMPILRGFGLYAALGVSLSFLTLLVVVPLALSVVGDDAPPPLPGLRPLDAVVGFALRRPWLTLIASAALTLLALVPAAGVTIDNQLSGLLSPTHPTSVASRRVDAELGGVLGLEFDLRAPPGVDLREPSTLLALHGFEVWLAAQPEVRAVEGLASLVADAGPLVAEPARIPAARASIDARLDALAPYAPLERLVREQGRLSRIHAGMPDAGGQQFVAFAERAEAELRARLASLERASPGARIEAEATGTALLAYRGVNGITADLRRSFALVFAVVVLIIAALFRSLWPALASLLPNGAPLLLGYATLGLLGVVLDPIAAVILTLALGIAVDDTLHVMVRTREELARGRALEPALRAALHHCGRAVAVTSIIIAGGLALNCMASFPPLRQLGMLGSLVISLALIADLLVLPAALKLLGGRGLGPGERAGVQRRQTP